MFFKSEFIFGVFELIVYNDFFFLVFLFNAISFQPQIFFCGTFVLLTEESKLQLFESLPKTRNNPPAKKNLRLVMTGTIHRFFTKKADSQYSLYGLRQSQSQQSGRLA